MLTSFKHYGIVMLCFVILPLSTVAAQIKKVEPGKRTIPDRALVDASKPPNVAGQPQNPRALLGDGVKIVAKDLDRKIIATLPNTFRAVRPTKVPPMLFRPGPAAPKFVVDLRPFIGDNQLFIRSPGNRGTCSVFATTFYSRLNMP